MAVTPLSNNNGLPPSVDKLQCHQQVHQYARETRLMWWTAQRHQTVDCWLPDHHSTWIPYWPDAAELGPGGNPSMPMYHVSHANILEPHHKQLLENLCKCLLVVGVPRCPGLCKVSAVPGGQYSM